MERKVPKNVRQIGNVSDSLKIYVEDYVDTYLDQLCEQEAERPVGAILIGETEKDGNQQYQYIYGAVQMKHLIRDGESVEITEEIWEECCETCKAFFGKGEILGWCAVIPGISFGMNADIKKTHQKLFSRDTGIFILKDPVCREELYFAPKFNDLMPMNGHYIYYEKNPDMQNYMISSRKKIGVTPSEVVADRAAKSFRNLVQTKMVMQERYKISKLARGIGVAAVLLGVLAAISFFRDYDRMKAMKLAVEAVSDTVQVKESKETQEEKEKEEEFVFDVGEEKSYTVESGDTLAGISKKIYGDLFHIEAISKENNLENGNLIYVGQKLVLP